MHNISQAGLQLIKQFEGCKLVAYKDGGGVWTIGYGHTANVFPKMTIMQVEADRLLSEDLKWAEATVNNHVKVPLTQQQYDALVSFVFNIGGCEFKSSTLLKKLNANEYLEAANQILRWDHDNGKVVRGLTNRRVAERALFVS